jgi:hypothetical protein
MKKYLHKILHPISMAIGHLQKFYFLKNSKGKYESRKILDFVRKNEKK